MTNKHFIPADADLRRRLKRLAGRAFEITSQAPVLPGATSLQDIGRGIGALGDAADTFTGAFTPSEPRTATPEAREALAPRTFVGRDPLSPAQRRQAIEEQIQGGAFSQVEQPGSLSLTQRREAFQSLPTQTQIGAGLVFDPLAVPGAGTAARAGVGGVRRGARATGRAVEAVESAGLRQLERVSPAKPALAAGDEAEGAARLFDDVSPVRPAAATAEGVPAPSSLPTPVEAAAPPGRTPPPAQAGGTPPPSGRPPAPPTGGGPPVPPPGEGEPVSKLTELIRAAKPVRDQTEALKSEELRRRAGVLASAQRGAQGEQAVLRTRAALKGELPKAQFDPPSVGLSQGDRDALFDTLNQTDKLRPLEKVGAADALVKVVNGQVPTIGEIATLEKVFGEDFASVLLSKRPWDAKFWDEVAGAANLPRAVVSSYDLSAPLRQGSWFSTSRPKEFVSAFKAQIRALKSEEAAQAIDDAIHARPNADIAEDAGLYLSPRGVSDISAREEAFMSRLAEKYIPGVGISQRAYVTFLNKLRSEVFDTVYDGWLREGRKVTKTDLQELARYVNVATGRGSLPAFMSKGNKGALLNALFFSPRFVTSRFEIARSMLSPSAPVRKQAWRDFSLYVGPRATVLGLGAAAGLWSLEVDPRSSDFGKARIGNVRIDPWGGWQPVIRYMAQLVTNRRKTLGTGEIAPVGLGERDWLDGAARTITRFGRSKLSPVAGAVADVAAGKTFTGEDVTVLGTAQRLFMPLIVDSVLESSAEVGIFWAVPLAVIEGLGTGVQAFDTSEDAPRPSLSNGRPSLRDLLNKPQQKSRPPLRELVNR